MKEVYIVAAVRTPMGSFGGTLAGVPAAKLGAAAIKGALERINLDPKHVTEVFMGSVMQANLGQALLVKPQSLQACRILFIAPP